jgi:purine-binding chemotaxis protein CheW
MVAGCTILTVKNPFLIINGFFYCKREGNEVSERQHVVFKLGNETYGIDIININEITENKKTTKVPNSPYYIEGVVNLRGNIVPVIDLKKRFNIKSSHRNENNRVIIVNIEGRQVGFLVDEASQVITLKEEDIDIPPEIIASVNSKFIVGIGQINEEIIMILDLKAIILSSEKDGELK